MKKTITKIQDRRNFDSMRGLFAICTRVITLHSCYMKIALVFIQPEARIFFFMYSITSKTIQTTFQYYTRIRKAEAFSASETTTYNILGLSTIIIITMENVNRIEIRSHETTFPNLMETNSSKFGWGLRGLNVYVSQNRVWFENMKCFDLAF